VSEPITAAPVDAVLIFEGVFLMRPELIDRWDLRIFVSAAFEETVARARSRDAVRNGTPSTSSDASATATYPRNGSTPTRSVRPITLTFSSATMSPSGPPGKSGHRGPVRG
jgi:hypothetical protein